MKTVSLLALTSSAVVLAAVAPATANGASNSASTRVISSCTHATYKPRQYVLTCADGNARISHTHYATWSARSATGRGTYVYNTCTPSCAGGTFKHHPVSFTLYRPRTVHGQRLFTRIDVTHGGLAETFSLPTRKV